MLCLVSANMASNRSGVFISSCLGLADGGGRKEEREVLLCPSEDERFAGDEILDTVRELQKLVLILG